MPLAVPNIPASSFSSSLVAGSFRSVTPTQVSPMSRIGSGLYAAPPGGLEVLFNAWGFMAGTAPPGTSLLVVTAAGTTFLRGCAYALGGYARAWAEIFVLVDEFEPLMPVDTGLIDTPDPGTAELADPTAVIGSIVFKQRFQSVSTIIINQETSFLGAQQLPAIDAQPNTTVIVMRITPGNVYRWWIASYQYCEVGVAGYAVSNIAFDFGPVFYAFT